MNWLWRNALDIAFSKRKGFVQTALLIALAMKLCFNWLKIADCGQQEFAVDINFLSDSNRIAMMIVLFNEAHLLKSEPPQAKCDEFNFNILKSKTYLSVTLHLR